MYKNLALKGAGVCGEAYTGAYLELEKLGITKGIERVAGTSAGAIVACLIALKYTSKEIFDISSSTDFSSFQDGNILDKINVYKNYGIHPGKTFLDWIKDKISKKGLPPNATFLDFKRAGCLDLNVFATDLNTKSLKQFCYSLTPNVIVAEAVRASMSIPLFFEAFQFTKNNPDNHIYIDGGCVFNYPLSTFDTFSSNDETLGLFIGDLSGHELNDNLSKYEFIKYIKILVETILNSQSINLIKEPEDLKRTIIIDNCGISATNFDLSTKDKEDLFESGRRAVIDYFKNKS
jgi:NTE family protein